MSSPSGGLSEPIRQFSRRPYWQQTADLFNTVYKRYVKPNVAEPLRVHRPLDRFYFIFFYPSPEGNRTLI